MTHPDESHPIAGRRLSRRSVVRTAAWSVPAVTVISAAPAFAATGEAPTWTISQNSFRGVLATETRATNGDHHFRFSITVTGAALQNAMMVFALLPAGNGGTLTALGTASPTNPATLDGWSVAYSSEIPNPETFTFSKPTLDVGVTTLNFSSPNSIGATDAPNVQPPVVSLVFSADGVDTKTFGFNAANAAGGASDLLPENTVQPLSL